jgi:hypothetical protein
LALTKVIAFYLFRAAWIDNQIGDRGIAHVTEHGVQSYVQSGVRQDLKSAPVNRAFGAILILSQWRTDRLPTMYVHGGYLRTPKRLHA